MTPAQAVRSRPAVRAQRAPAAAPEVAVPLKVVPRHRRRSRRRRLPRLEYVAVALVVASLLAVVVGHTMLASGQVTLSNEQAQLTAEQSIRNDLLLNVAALEAPARIAAAARKELHMSADNGPQQLRYVPLTVPLPAPHVTAAPPATTTTTVPSP